jgi:class 3 adenylate cyclase/tetratricopeptide (TPR) repeat protein
MPPTILGERKHMTVMFSDLSGYTSMTEKLDPEEVTEIMSRIFGEISQIAKKYEGIVGRFLGDAAMVLFGVPLSHEDDAVRAIRAAREIHTAVEAISFHYQGKIGWPLRMHTGISSGLVVVGEPDVHRVGGEITGDTVNLASRLCGLAKAGAILVGPDTYRLAQAHFFFKRCDAALVKGRTESVEPYEVLAPRERPEETRRLHGLRAKLVGRVSEMALLVAAAERMQQGRVAVVSICGDPGTGKSRLVEEFKTTLDRQRFQWLAAYAYGYTHKIPYWPLIDLLNRIWKIEEEDSPDSVRRKIEVGARAILGRTEGACSLIGSLYALDSPELQGMSPELWRARLFDTIRNILAVFAARRPTIICLEDLQWADPPSLELVRFLIAGGTVPALFLCVFRPPFELFPGKELENIEDGYQELRLQDLTPVEAEQMMESLLRTRTIPPELRQFMHRRTEGNPFYLEEVVNSLIESETLVQRDGAWELTKPLSESGISPTIHGVIAARLDRLDAEMKKVLQEASVIGRNFLYVILQHITALRDYLQDCLSGLERLDLIRTKALQPELEYIFKHALTQEVVYTGLLRKERQAVHERIGQVMEVVFRDRLPEIYETLALHYTQGNSADKAVDYLVKSGEKSQKRYAVEESHHYFKEAFDLLTRNRREHFPDAERLIDLILKWASVFYYSGEYRKLQELFEAHRSLAETLNDKSRLGMFYAWLSCALWHREKGHDAYDYLVKALRLGGESGDLLLQGYANTWLTWTCLELGRLDEAAKYAEKAQILCQSADVDHYLYFNSLAGLAYVHFHRGERRETLEKGRTLVEFGQEHSNIRCMVMGYCFMGYSYMTGGDIPVAASYFEEAVRVSADPWYAQFPSLALCYARIAHGEYEGTQETLERIIAFSEERGAEYVGTPGKLLLGAVLVAHGELGRGMKQLEAVAETWRQSGNQVRYAVSQLIMGRVYALMAQGTGRKKLSTIFKNLGFLLKNALFADRKAMEYLNRAVEVAREIGANETHGRACLSLGLLHKARGRDEQARECLVRAVKMFEDCAAEAYLKEAKEALLDLG